MDEVKPWKKKGDLEKIVNSAIDVGFMGFAAAHYLTSSLLTWAGFTTADLITKRKKKEKITPKVFLKSAWDNAAHASQNGFAQEEMYRHIDAVPNKSLLGKIGKTLLFNPVVAAVYQLYYQAQQYIRDEIGWVRAIGGVFNPSKLKMYLKDFYQTRLKGKYWKKVWTVFKRVSPIHYATINHVDDWADAIGVPGMPVKMGIAGGNDVIFALASKPGQEEKKPANVYQMPAKTYEKPANIYQMPQVLPEFNNLQYSKAA